MKSALYHRLLQSLCILPAVVGLLGGCGGDPIEPADRDAGVDAAEALVDASNPDEPDAYTQQDDAATPIEPDAYIAVDAGDADFCSASTTFECGASTCTLQQMCVRDGGDDTCWDLPADDRCTPCSTQYGSIPAAARCVSGFPEYSGDSSVGCTVTCF